MGVPPIPSVILPPVEKPGELEPEEDSMPYVSDRMLSAFGNALDSSQYIVLSNEFTQDEVRVAIAAAIRAGEQEDRKRLDPLGEIPSEIELDPNREIRFKVNHGQGEIRYVYTSVTASTMVQHDGAEIEVTVSYPLKGDEDDTDKRIMLRTASQAVQDGLQGILGGTPWEFSKS